MRCPTLRATLNPVPQCPQVASAQSGTVCPWHPRHPSDSLPYVRHPNAIPAVAPGQRWAEYPTARARRYADGLGAGQPLREVWIREVLGDVVRYESDRLRAAGLGLRTVPLAEFRRGQWALLAGDASAPLEAFWALVALHHVAIGQRWLRVDEPHGRRLVYVVADVVEVGRACAGCIVYEAGRRFDVRVVVYWHQLRNPRRFLLLANLACPRCHKQHVEPDHLAAVAHEVHQCVSDADGPGCGHQWRVHPMALGAAPPPGVAVLAAARGGA